MVIYEVKSIAIYRSSAPAVTMFDGIRNFVHADDAVSDVVSNLVVWQDHSSLVGKRCSVCS